ncbi:PKP4, partial [Cervus elaphus hippelaphus]
VPNTGVNKPRVSDAVHPNNYFIRTEPEPGTLYSPEQTSLHESEGSLGNSRSSTQMNSYSDSGYQEAGSFHNSQNLSKADNRPQHSFVGSTNNHLVRNSRAEGQTLVQLYVGLGQSPPGRPPIPTDQPLSTKPPPEWGPH